VAVEIRGRRSIRIGLQCATELVRRQGRRDRGGDPKTPPWRQKAATTVIHVLPSPTTRSTGSCRQQPSPAGGRQFDRHHFFNPNWCKRPGTDAELGFRSGSRGCARQSDQCGPAEITVKGVDAAARAIGCKSGCSTPHSHEIDAAFANFVRERPDALFIGRRHSIADGGVPIGPPTGDGPCQ